MRTSVRSYTRAQRWNYRVIGDPKDLRGMGDPCRPKGSPLCTTLRYPCLVTDPKNFLKALLAPIYPNFEERARAKKKRDFLVKTSKNCQKSPFLAYLFKILPAAQKICQNTAIFVLRENLKINLVDLKKVM